MSVKRGPVRASGPPAVFGASLARIGRQARWLLWAGIDLLLPARCAVCGAEGTFLCRACLGAIPELPADAQTPDVRSVWAMEDVARSLVHQLKYGGLRALAPPLGTELAGLVRRWEIEIDAVTHVPLHRSRLRRRGYDQARALAEAAAEELGLPFVAALERTGAGSSQVETGSRRQRMHNVQHAFHATAPLEVAGMRILLVDDVTTTGATLASAGEALRGAGAKQVFSVTVTREL